MKPVLNKALNVIPNIALDNFRQKTKTIGVIFPYVPGIFYSEYYTNILAGIAEYLIETDYRFKLLLLKDDQSWDNYTFQLKEGVDGLILTHWFKIFSDKYALEKLKIPIIIINDFYPRVKANFVYVNQVLGGRLAAEHLYSCGHRNIGILSGPSWSLDSRQRLEGFINFMKTKNISFKKSLIVDGKFLEQEAYKNVEDLINKNNKITAIFCCNDQMAMGALRKLKELNINCPKDISLIGYDNQTKSALLDPPLTTVAVNVPTLAMEATKALIEMLEHSPDAPPMLKKIHPVAPTLIKRESVRKIN